MPGTLVNAAPSSRPRWLMSWAPLIAAWLAVLALFRGTAESMVAMWDTSTYQHAYLVPPIAAWLAWRLRHAVAAAPIRPQPWVLAGIALTGLAWLASELATVGVVAHFALVTMLVLAVPAVLGPDVTRVLRFPLVFLYFAVPFGDAVVPWLMDWTADFTVLALRWTGVPVLRDGLQFVIPSGSWSVVEACSGIRYLIASFMVGTLFAYLNYRTPWRRLLFVGVSLLVPIVANWLRAYMIVMIGHLSDNRLAVGVDHLIYGWVFFGVVVGLMFLIGARWTEHWDPPGVAAPVSANPGDRRPWLAAAGVLAVLAGIQAAHAAYTRPLDAAAAPALMLDGGGQGWQRDAQAHFPWIPGWRNPAASAEAVYAAADGPRVAVWVGHYRGQGPQRKLVSSVNGLVPERGEGWAQTARGMRAAAGPLPAFLTAEMRQGEQVGSIHAARYRVWHLYWVGGRWETSEVRAKLWQALDRLAWRGDDGAVVVLATLRTDDADMVLRRFAEDRLDAVAQQLAAAAASR